MTTENRKVQIPVEVDAAGAKAGFDQVKAGARDMAQAVEQAGQQASRGVDGIGAGAPASAQKLDAATRSIIGSIQRTTAVMEAGGRTSSKYYEALAAQRGVSVDALKPYLAQLDAVSAKQVQATSAVVAGAAGLNTLGMSARATTAALRQVPAQFTDIVTSLAAGQRPLQVLLQQGGQLKDTFGGIGPAAQALGGYVRGLVNPFTIAAGAVAALGVAYYQGSQEADNYTRALVLTGDVAGATAQRLQETARAVASITGTQSAAADAVSQLAGTGRVAAGNLEQFSRVALLLEKNVGVAVKETVNQFEELGRSPVEASAKLTDRANYLTAAVYQQIRALEEQGRLAEAGALAQRTYADAMGLAAARVENNLGAIEGAWRAVTSVAKTAWDVMLGVGRRETIADQAEVLRRRIAQNELERGQTGPNGRAAIDKGLDVLKQQLNLLTEQDRMLKRGAEAAAERVKAERAGIEFSKIEAENRTRQQKAEVEIARIRQLGLQAGRSELEIEKQVAAVREKYKDKGGEAATKAAKTQYDDLLLRVRERIALADEELAAGRKLTDAEKLEVQITALLASEKNKLNDTRKKAILAELEELKVKELRKAVDASELVQAQEIAKARQAARNADYGQSAEAVRAIEEARAASVTTVRDQVKALQDEVAARDLSIAQNISLEEAIERVTIARLEEKRALLVDGSEAEESLRREIDLRKQLAQGFGERAAFSRQVDGLREIDSVARDVFNDVGESGVSAAERIGKAFKASVADVIYQMTVRPLVVQIAGTVTGASPAAIAQAASGGQGGITSLLNTGSSLFGNLGGIGGALSSASYAAAVPGLTSFGAGSQAAMLAAQTSGFGAAGLGATATAGGSAFGGAITTIGAAVPYIGAAVVAAMVAKQLFDKPGGPKSEGAYGNLQLLDELGARGSSDGTSRQTALTTAKALQQQYDSLAQSFGVRGGLQFGVGFATDPEGTAPTFLEVAAGRGGKPTYSTGSASLARGEEAFAINLADFSAKTILKALQDSGLKGGIADYLRDLGDIDKLSRGSTTNALERVKKAGAERVALEQQLYALTTTELEQLNDARKKERKALDETNRALFDQVAKLTDLKAVAANAAAAVDATKGALLDAYQREVEKAQNAADAVVSTRDALRDAYERESDALQDVVTRHRDYARQLRDVRDSLLLSDLSPLSAQQQTARASAAFNATLKSARKGNDDALAGLGGAGSEFLRAAQSSARDPVEYAMAFARVQAGLTTAAASADGRATVAEKQQAALDKQLKGILDLKDTALSVKEALRDYLKAESKQNIAEKTLDAYTKQLKGLGLIDTSIQSMSKSLTAYLKAVALNTAAMARASKAGIPGFATGGYTGGGVITAGERGTEVLDLSTPARVYTAEQTRGMFSANTELLPTLREVASELKALRADGRIVDTAIVKELQKSSAILKKFDTIGLPAERTTA